MLNNSRQRQQNKNASGGNWVITQPTKKMGADGGGGHIGWGGSAHDHDGINTVDPNLRDKKHGELKGKSANELYKKYVGWTKAHCKKDGPRCMTFKEWLAWAQAKGVVKKGKKHNAAGDEDEDTAPAGDTKVVKAVKNVGKIVGVVVVVAATIALLGAIAAQGEKHIAY